MEHGSLFSITWWLCFVQKSVSDVAILNVEFWIRSLVGGGRGLSSSSPQPKSLMEA
jgi:hypothetical protein